MIFRQVQEIINGVKTQTRRVVTENETDNKTLDYAVLEEVGIVKMPAKHISIVYTGVYGGSLRVKWQVGRDYAVVAKRGTRGVCWCPFTGAWYVPETASDKREAHMPLRVRVTGIRQEPLQNISEADARAEGVSSLDTYAHLWGRINDRAGVRWHDNPLVWVIKFEVAS